MAAQINDFKVCPQCGAKVFSDMDTCFGCLYRFDDKQPSINQTTLDADWPDQGNYYEADDIKLVTREVSPEEYASDDSNHILYIFTDGAKIKVPFIASSIQIGSSSACDVVIDNPLVENVAASLVKKDSCIQLNPVGDNQLIYQNGHKVNKSTNLITDTTFYILDMRFELLFA